MKRERLRLGEHVSPDVPPALDFKSRLCEMARIWVEREDVKCMQYMDQKKKYLHCISEVEKLQKYENLKEDYKIKLEELEKNQMLFWVETNETVHLMSKTMALLENKYKDIPESGYYNGEQINEEELKAANEVQPQANEQQPEVANVVQLEATEEQHETVKEVQPEAIEEQPDEEQLEANVFEGGDEVGPRRSKRKKNN
ncbi:uncharacterized protein LOC122037407 [Zingiber officinale]|uniref:uncharacterized protein LOC122037407 n=1 Tax=Zingiber officinale TaxID=94328 RepID=UPI001C4D216F|nr:uncharacterized protein LOC122037407 [Zingiber officinale]XP_042452806.1 uncharacterized protein LOC122037407 [Zingiber officinale]XP_042452807.1 uncharacterized protein LOC122037407 [Zingiber officinale]XP_042452808.1 uncharacterized protein LOC122037407 [Zingiber officinale]XP_042452809.1 uncharacterized protein LOC122037407 [Zingiber officinale]XP_042452810.1 uncharacterized protein LOC122037407 [Zingiber officinale]XP_042452811.1 uncharacterized protein LOC122037407 [Zingiber officinal